MLAVVLAFVADCYPGRRADSCAAALAKCLFQHFSQISSHNNSKRFHKNRRDGLLWKSFERGLEISAQARRLRRGG